MSNAIVSLFGDFGVLVVLVVWLAIVALTLAIPWMLVSITMSLRGIHRELTRLNDAEPWYRPAIAAVTSPAPASAPTPLAARHVLR